MDAPTDAEDALGRLPERIGALVMDFDGVHTDNRVFVDQHGIETVVCHRGDGFGLELLRKAGLPMVVISKETNPVVQARCHKLQLPCHGSIEGKLAVMTAFCATHGVELAHTVYIGNDLNDLECMAAVGCGVAVADAHPQVRAQADLVLDTAGGQGALRELAELILQRISGSQAPA